MATLKSLLADRSSSSSVDFRNNDKPSADGTLWAYAWVEDTNGKLLCIGATVDTLNLIAANPKIDTLMLTKPEPRVHSSNNIDYDLCQLYIINKISTTEPNNENLLMDNCDSVIIESQSSLKLNQWQKNIYTALKNEGTFDLKILKIHIESDVTGIEFMQHIAYHKKTYEYLSGLNLINTGHCPITGKKIDKAFNYSILGRIIYLSEEALALGEEKKEKNIKQFQKENPNYEDNLKQSKAFLENTKPYVYKRKQQKFYIIIFICTLFLTGYLFYKFIKP